MISQSEASIMNGQPIRSQYYLEEELLAVGVDEGHEGLNLPGHGDQVAEEAGGALDRMLLRHGEAGDGRLQSSKTWIINIHSDDEHT